MIQLKSRQKLFQNMSQPLYEKEYHELNYINVNVIEGCNSKCIICYHWNNKLKVLSISEFINNILKTTPFLSKTKTIVCNISADGEPLINPNFFEMVKYSNSRGFQTTTVSNSLLINAKNAKKMVESKLHHINLSLESSDSLINDKIRGIKGHKNKVLNAIKLISKYKKELNGIINTGILTTVCSYNLKSIPNLIYFINKNNDISSIRLQTITPIFNHISPYPLHIDENNSHLWPKDKKLINSIYNTIINLKKKGYKIENSIHSLLAQKHYFLFPEKLNPYTRFTCNVRDGFIIDSNKNIVMCPMGNNINTNFGENIILKTSQGNPNYKSTIKKIIMTQKRIINCQFINCHIKLNCNFSGNEQKRFG